MAYYQNTLADATKLIIGNCKIETAASAGSVSWVNLGNGIVNGFKHNVEVYNVQSGNGPDPIEGISKETGTIDAQLIEYDASVIAAISCGQVTATSTTAQSTLVGGGNAALTPRAFRLTNTKMVSGVTKQTVLTVFYATMATGFELQFKSDNDADPIAVMPVQITAKNDTSLTAGSQLFKIVKDL